MKSENSNSFLRKRNTMMTVIMFTLMTVIFSVGVSAALTDGLLAYYKLEENNTPIKDSTLLYNGTANTEIYSITGLIDKGQNMSGSGGASLPPEYWRSNIPVSQRALPNMSQCVWMNWYRQNIQGAGVVLMAWRDVPNVNGMGIETLSTTTFRIHIWGSGDSWTSNFAYNNATGFHQYCFVMIDGNRLQIWEDGVVKINESVTQRTFTGDVTTNFFTGVAWGDSTIKGYDEVGYWNRSLSTSEITLLYNSGAGLSYPFSTLSMIFNGQKPVDLTSTNAFSTRLNITYNITSVSNASTIKLYHQLKSSSLACDYYGNGSCVTAINTTYTQSSSSNSSNTYQFLFNDNQVYPGVYAYPNETLMENMTKSRGNLSAGTSSVKMSLYNVSNKTSYNLFETYINVTGAPQPMQVLYCNSSYVSGSYQTSNNCFVFANIASNFSYNHSHTTQSYHVMLPFTIQNGSIGLVNVTSTSQFILRGASGGEWSYMYIPNITRVDNVQTSANSGVNWNNLIGSMDMHIHQFSTNDSFCYKATADGTNTTELCDNLDLTPMPPSLVNFYSPNSSIYSGSVMINYTASFSPTNASIASYNLSLCNQDFSMNMSIYNTTSALNYTYNIMFLPDGNYSICVDVYDTQRLSSRSYSPVFSVDNIPPFITFTYPGANNLSWCYTGSNCTMDINLTDLNLYAYELSIIAPNGSLGYYFNKSDIARPSYKITDIYVPVMNGTYIINVSATDSHTKKNIADYTFNYKTKGFKYDFIKSSKSKSKRLDSVEIDYIGDYTISSLSTKKNFDRYNFTMGFNLGSAKDKKVSLNFRIKCADIRFIDSDYTAHFVCWNASQWVDFESPAVTGFYITNMTYDTAEFTIETNGSENIAFSSIGGVNRNTQSVVLTVIDRPGEIAGTLTMGTCPSSSSSVWMYIAVLFFGLMLFFIGMKFKMMMPAVMSGILMLVLSAIVAACNIWIGTILFITGLMFMWMSGKLKVW